MSVSRLILDSSVAASRLLTWLGLGLVHGSLAVICSPLMSFLAVIVVIASLLVIVVSTIFFAVVFSTVAILVVVLILVVTP